MASAMSKLPGPTPPGRTWNLPSMRSIFVGPQLSRRFIAGARRSQRGTVPIDGPDDPGAPAGFALAPHANDLRSHCTRPSVEIINAETVFDSVDFASLEEEEPP